MLGLCRLLRILLIVGHVELVELNIVTDVIVNRLVLTLNVFVVALHLEE
jgi:hypothetical protein